MKFIDLFAGIGGFRLGMEMAGHECVGFCEIDKFAEKSYRAMHNTKGEWFADDIRAIKPRDMPDFDYLTGGFPCQSFSVAGKRGGFEDTRGTLFFEIARIIRERQPKLVFLENVRGLLNHDGGRTFGTILNTFWELGYDVEWQLLNSKDFGVSQNRERVFIIGYPRGSSRRKIFPIGGTGNPTGKSIKRLAHSKHYRRVYQTFSKDGSCEALDTMQGGGRQPCVLVINKNGNIKENNTEGQYASTLTGGGHSGGNHSDMDLIVQDGTRIRRLTPKECFRLQGFPDKYFDRAREVNSDSQLYKQAGNSVTVNVIYEIARRL